MANPIVPASRGFTLVLLAGILGCASGELLLPDPPGGGENVKLLKMFGDGQVGTVGEPLPERLVVQVLTLREQPVSGRRVAFVLTTSDGEVTPDTAITNSQGQATASWVLGTAPGDYAIEARLVTGGEEPQTEEFTAAAYPAPPDTLRPLSPVSQPGRRGQTVSTPPLVRVVDRYGNPVPDVPVAWQVTAGEGQVDQLISRTASDGSTSAEWILGDRIGIHKLTATIEQATVLPATFTATVLF